MTSTHFQNIGNHTWKKYILDSKYIDAKDETGAWRLAVVDKFKSNSSVVHVHFDGWSEEKYNEVSLGNECRLGR